MKIGFREYLKIGIAIFILYLCINYWQKVAHFISLMLSAAAPLIIGAITAYFVNILMSIYERLYFPKSGKAIVLKSRKPVCMTAAFLTIIAIISLVIGIVLPQFISCLQLLFRELPSALSYLAAKTVELNIVPDNIADFLIEIDWQSRIGKIAEMLTAGVGNLMNVAVKAVSTVFSGIVTSILSIIFAVYILSAKDKLKSQFNRIMKHYLPDMVYKKILYVLNILNDCFHRYIVGQCVEAVILGALCALGMLTIGLPYAPMIGTLVGFTALVPIVGSYIGAAVGTLMILTISPIKSLVFLVYIVVLQQFEGNVIYPRVVGNSIGLPGLWVLVAVTIGGGIMGIAGMLLGVPVAATIYRIIRDDLKGESLLNSK